MAATEKKQLRTVEIDGDTWHVDDKKAKGWKSFELCGVLAKKNADVFEQADAAFELIEYASDCTREAIIDKFGGDDASPQEVVKYALQLVAEIAPKNS